MTMPTRCLLVLLLLLLFPGPLIAAPGLDAGAREYDFGNILQGDTVTHTFIFVNDGDAPLLIDRLKSSCGCTAALLSAKNIPPGGEGTIKATFDSSRFRGPVRKVIFLYSNLPGREVTQFALRGTVNPLVEFDPPQIDFGEVRPGEEKQLPIAVTNHGSVPLRIENIRASNTALSGDSRADQLPPGVPTTISVTARPGTDHQHLRGYLLIRTDRAALGELRVPVSGSVAR